MTEAEKVLLESVLEFAGEASFRDPDYFSPFKDAAHAVLRERLPPEFEQTIGDLAERSVAAQQALWDFAKRHPLGSKIASEAVGRARKARGI